MCAAEGERQPPSSAQEDVPGVLCLILLFTLTLPRVTKDAVVVVSKGMADGQCINMVGETHTNCIMCQSVSD